MADVNIQINAEDNFSTVLGNFGSIVTGIESIINLVGEAFSAASDFIGEFVDSAANSELELAKFDTVLASTSANAGITTETIGKLSNVGLLNLQQQLEAAKNKLKEMDDTYPSLKHRTEEQNLAIEVQREKIANLTNQLQLGTNGLIIFKDTTQLSRDQMIELSKAIQNTTIYNDEMVLSAEGMMLRFENINSKIFPDAIKLSTDLAASLGIDLTTAARMVGMALDDPEKGIGRLNTAYRVFDDSQMSVIKNMAASGDLAGAQAMIMDALTQKFGGAAEAIGKTFTGQLEIAKNKLDDIKELIGNAFLPVLTGLLAGFSAFASQPGVINFFTDFSKLIASIINQDFSKITDLFNYFATLFSGVDFTNLNVLGDILNNVLGSFVLSGVGVALVTILTNIGSSLAVIFAGAGELGTFATVFLTLTTTIGGFTSILIPVAGIIAGITVAMGILNQTTNGLIPSFGELATTLQNWVKSIDWKSLSDNIAAGINSIDWNAIGQQIIPALKVFGDTIRYILVNIDWKAIGDAMGNALAAIVAGLYGYPDWNALGKDFKNGFVYVGQQAQLGFASAFGESSWENLATDFVNGFRYIGQQIASAFGYYGWDAWSNLWTDFEKGWNYTLSKIKSLLGISSPSSVFAGIAHDLVAGLIAGWNASIGSFLSAIGNTIEDIGNLFGIDLGSLLGGSGAIGSHDTGGGTVGGSTGDLSHNAGGSSTGGQTVINIYGTSYWGVGGPGDVGSVYDCPSPSPMVAASGNQLVRTGF